MIKLTETDDLYILTNNCLRILVDWDLGNNHAPNSSFRWPSFLDLQIRRMGRNDKWKYTECRRGCGPPRDKFNCKRDRPTCRSWIVREE